MAPEFVNGTGGKMAAGGKSHDPQFLGVQSQFRAFGPDQFDGRQGILQRLGLGTGTGDGVFKDCRIVTRLVEQIGHGGSLMLDRQDVVAAARTDQDRPFGGFLQTAFQQQIRFLELDNAGNIASAAKRMRGGGERLALQIDPFGRFQVGGGNGGG